VTNGNKDNYDEKSIKKAKSTIESYLINNFKDIESVKFEGDFFIPWVV